ncbi:POK18 protein, partial [Callaeas wilsoni]|nr:POK18 protein [Callaeas wilsoni]
TVKPQAISLRTRVSTPNDLQKLLGTISWVRPPLGITNQDLRPLFELLKGDTHIVSP